MNVLKQGSTQPVFVEERKRKVRERREGGREKGRRGGGRKDGREEGTKNL